MDVGVMEKSTINIIKLTAAEGMTLTNGEAFGKEIYLGKTDKTENWHEITDAEAEARQKELDAPDSEVQGG